MWGKARQGGKGGEGTRGWAVVPTVCWSLHVNCVQAPKIVMGPGTGLGAAQLLWDEGLQDYKVWPGE